MIKELIKVANRLDYLGFKSEADTLDRIIIMANHDLESHDDLKPFHDLGPELTSGFDDDTLAPEEIKELLRTHFDKYHMYVMSESLLNKIMNHLASADIKKSDLEKNDLEHLNYMTNTIGYPLFR